MSFFLEFFPLCPVCSSHLFDYIERGKPANSYPTDRQTHTHKHTTAWCHIQRVKCWNCLNQILIPIDWMCIFRWTPSNQRLVYVSGYV